MNSFDHKNRKENYGATRSRNDRSETSFNREDSRRSTREENALSTFSRDKRPRPQRTSTTEGQGGSASGFRKENSRRRSFNPNFTKDNRRTDQVRSTRRDDTQRSSNRYGYYRDENTESAESPRYTESRKPFNRTNGYKSKNTRHADTEQYGTGYKRRPNRRSGGFSTTSHREAYPRFEAPKPQGAIRLNRFIANSGICSRREADDLITAGVISVNGKIVSELGTKVNPEDEIRFNGEVINGLYRTLAEGHGSGKRFFSKDRIAYVDRGRILIQPIPDDECCKTEIAVDADKVWCGGCVLTFTRMDVDDVESLRQPQHVALLDADKLKYPLAVRRWVEGDWFVPFGMERHKKISDFLIDCKVPLPDKKRQLVVVSGDDIVWVVGRRIDDRYKIGSSTENVLRIVREVDSEV